MAMKQEKYVITAISRLTGVREVVTAPHSLQRTEELRCKLARSQHSHSAYSHLKVEPYYQENNLFKSENK